MVDLDKVKTSQLEQVYKKPITSQKFQENSINIQLLINTQELLIKIKSILQEILS